MSNLLQVYVDEYSRTKYIYRGTCIVSFDLSTKTVCLNTNDINNRSWLTATTKKFMNRALVNTPYRVVQKQYQWYIVNTETGKTIPYKDYIKLPVKTIDDYQ